MSINFENYLHDSNALTAEVARELKIDNKDKARRVTRAVLHAVRDRLPLNEAIHFGQQLPMIWKGIYFDQMDAGKLPLKIRDRENFIQYIISKDHGAETEDFKDQSDVRNALHAVFSALERMMDPGILQHVKGALNKEIVDMIEH